MSKPTLGNMAESDVIDALYRANAWIRQGGLPGLVRRIQPSGGGGGNTGGVELLEWPVTAAKCECLPSESVFLQIDHTVLNERADGSVGPLVTDTTEHAFIIITWGGVGHFIECDLVQGFSIALTGTRLSVKLHYPLQDLPVTQPLIDAHASLGFGTAKPVTGISGILRRTRSFGTVVDGAQSDITQIPPWSDCAVFQNPSAANPTLVFRQFTNSLGGLIDEVDLGKLGADSVKIANGARFCALFNPGVAAVANARVVFYLGT